MPEQKITTAAIAGAVVTIAIWVLRGFNVQIPAEVAAASTTLLAAVAGWLAPHTDRPAATSPPDESRAGSRTRRRAWGGRERAGGHGRH